MMNPISQHIQQLLPQLPPTTDVDCLLRWNFDLSLNVLTPEFYNKALPLHLLLHLEYSILCTQLHQDLLIQPPIKSAVHSARLIAALQLCELLAHIYQHYLLIPREVQALREQQLILRQLLKEKEGYSFANDLSGPAGIPALFSPSQFIRMQTIRANWARTLMGRTNRAMNLLGAVCVDLPLLQGVIRHLEQHYTTPFLAWFGLFFHVPRLSSNTFLFLKHTIPGFWMQNEEASLSLISRLVAQLQRRWFEFGNDIVWTGLSVLSVAILLGCSVPSFIYFSLTAFAFDAVNALARALVELPRLTLLHQHYTDLLAETTDSAEREVITQHLHYIEQRQWFEQQRLGLSFINMTLVFIAMSVALPLLGASTPVLFASAVSVLALWAAVYFLATVVEAKRPPERLIIPPADTPPKNDSQVINRAHFFAPKPAKTDSDSFTPSSVVEPTTSIK